MVLNFSIDLRINLDGSIWCILKIRIKVYFNLEFKIMDTFNIIVYYDQKTCNVPEEILMV